MYFLQEIVIINIEYFVNLVYIKNIATTTKFILILLKTSKKKENKISILIKNWPNNPKIQEILNFCNEFNNNKLLQHIDQ